MSYEIDDFMFNSVITVLEVARKSGISDMGLLDDLKEIREEKFKPILDGLSSPTTQTEKTQMVKEK